MSDNKSVMDKSVNITTKTSGCSAFIIKPCMIQLTNIGVFNIVNGEIGENTSKQNYCTVDPAPCKENQNHMDSYAAEITQKSVCNGSGDKVMNSNQILVKGCSGSNDPINSSGINSVIQSQNQNGCIAVNSSEIQERSHISVEMGTHNNTRMTPNISDESEIINISMKKTYRRPVRACRIKPVLYIDDPIETEDDLSRLDVVQTCSKGKFTNTNKSKKTFSGNAEQGDEKDIKKGINRNCKGVSDAEKSDKQRKIFKKNDKLLNNQNTVIRGKLDKRFEWNAIHKCPLCQDIFIEKEDFKQHIKQSEKCNIAFNCRIRKSTICYCKPCKYQTRCYKSFWAHMFKSGPHGLLGSSSFPKSYDLLDSVDKEFDSKFTLEFDNLRRKWFGSHEKFYQLTSSTADNSVADNNAKCDASFKNKVGLDNVDKNEKTTRENSRHCKETEKNDDADNDCTTDSKNDCSVVDNDCSKTENTNANICHNDCYNDDNNNAFIEELDVESGNNCDDCFLTDTAVTDVAMNNNECVGKDNSYAHIMYDCKNAKIEGRKSDCDLKFKIGYFCNYCGKVQRYRRFAYEHFKTHTHISESVQCDVCGKTLANSNSLRKHKLTHIHVSRQCNLCGATFNSVSGLSYHKRKHKGLKKVKKLKFNCKYCDKKFEDRLKRKNHELVHTGEKPYVCDECGSCFRVKMSLNKHIMLRHTAKEEIEKVLCKVCGKTYNQFYFYLHKRSHEERRYKCNDCGKSFVLKHHLKSHMLSHTNVRLFQCSLCGFSFTLKHHLQSHLKTKHDVQNV